MDHVDGIENAIAAGTPITHRARFAGPHLATRCSKYFVIRHGRLLLCGGKAAVFAHCHCSYLPQTRKCILPAAQGATQIPVGVL